jgi:FkbM family methyltransferase
MIAAKSVPFFLKYFTSDPLRLADFVRRRAVEGFSSLPRGICVTKFGDVQFEIDLSIHRLMAKYFFHTHEMYLERIFDRYLVADSIFVDVGANCGYWSAYALSRVGRSGQIHSFEPVPDYFFFLGRLAELNPDYNINASNVACGARADRLRMAVVLPRADNFDNFGTNVGSSSLLPGFLDHAKCITEFVNVNVIALDDYLLDQNVDIDRIGLIKIDVEGAESQVLDGMQRVLSKPGKKVPILCEILTDLDRTNPLNGRKTIARLERCGYRCVNAIDLRPFDSLKLNFEENVLCV